MMKLFAYRRISSTPAGGVDCSKQQPNHSGGTIAFKPSHGSDERDNDEHRGGVVVKKALHASPDTVITSSSRMSTRSLTSVSDEESTLSVDRHTSAEEASYLIERGISLYETGDVIEAQRCWVQAWEDLGVTSPQLETVQEQWSTTIPSNETEGQMRCVQSLRVKVLGYLLSSHLRHDSSDTSSNNQNQSRNMAAFYTAQLASLAIELGDYETDKFTVVDQLLFHFDAAPTELDALWKLLMDGEHWQLALQLAIRREKGDPHSKRAHRAWMDHTTMARLYYKVSLMGSDVEKSIASLKTCLSLLPSKRASSSTATLRRSALECLVELEGSRGNYDAAMEWHRKLVKSLPSHSSQLEKAKANYQLVKAIYIPQNDIASAISQLNRILALLEHDEHHVDEKKDHQDHPTITDNFQFRLELLQMKATLEVQRCNWNAALSDYQDILQLMEHESQEENATTSPDVLAKHYYMMGRICVKLSKYEEALRYFSRELNITQEVVGACSLAVSRILHELAAIYENGLGDNEKALERYQEALRIEELVVKECHKASHKSTLSSSPPRRNKSSTCKNRLQEALHQRRETQRCIGRIHFKRGDFDRALQTSLIGSVGLPK